VLPLLPFLFALRGLSFRLPSSDCCLSVSITWNSMEIIFQSRLTVHVNNGETWLLGQCPASMLQLLQERCCMHVPCSPQRGLQRA
jgi:hypothetical protein